MPATVDGGVHLEAYGMQYVAQRHAAALRALLKRNKPRTAHVGPLSDDQYVECPVNAHFPSVRPRTPFPSPSDWSAPKPPERGLPSRALSVHTSSPGHHLGEYVGE